LLPRASLIAVDAFHRDSRGNDAADAFSLAQALDALLEHEVTVINLSVAGPANAVLRQVIETAQTRGKILVAAAGNDGPGAAPLYPAAYRGVVGVTAVDHRHRVWRQASAGPQVDFAAPGVRLSTAAPTAGRRQRSGTSFASPFVAAALAVSQLEQQGHSASDIVSALAMEAVDLGTPGQDNTYGHGLVQAPQRCAVKGASSATRPASINPVLAR
jgi:subtilisin family serine protease